MRVAILTLIMFALAGCQSDEPIIHADVVELIHVDTQATTINVTVSGSDGRATVVLTPKAALQLQAELGRTFSLLVEGAEALRAQQQSPAPAP